jgi:hypothetical protein
MEKTPVGKKDIAPMHAIMSVKKARLVFSFETVTAV